MKANIKIKKTAGLTIVELLLDLVLSAIVMGTIFSLYINYKQSYEYQTDTIFLHQNAKSIYDYLNADIQVSGFLGCNSSASTLEYAFTPTFDYDMTNIISGFEASGTGPNTTTSLTAPASGFSPALQGQVSTAGPSAGSDVITIRFSDTNSIGILGSDTTGATMVVPDIQTQVAANDTLLISDCRRTVLFRVGSVATNLLTPTASVGRLNSGAEIYRININSYYVKTVNSIPSLYRMRNGSEELIVPYVENIQILYGQDTNGDGITDKYNTAGNITENPITNVSFSVLTRSMSKHTRSQTFISYKLFDAPTAIGQTSTVTTANDYYVRKVFDFNLYLPNAGGVL